MREEFYAIFAFIGAGTVGCIVVLIFSGLWQFFSSKIQYWKSKYKDAHRFDGAPKAKLYCVQCGHWKTSNPDKDCGLCDIWEKWTRDSEFCARSYPKNETDYEYEEWRIRK